MCIPGGHGSATQSRCSSSSPLIGASLQDSGLAEPTGVVVIAIRRPDGTFIHHPEPEVEPDEGDVLILLGTAGQLSELREGFDGNAA